MCYARPPVSLKALRTAHPSCLLISYKYHHLYYWLIRLPRERESYTTTDSGTRIYSAWSNLRTLRGAVCCLKGTQGR
jgi:hypothetical protein